MPRYFNPTNHKVTLSISEPRVTLIVWPRDWAPSQLPDKAVKTVELDERIARAFVSMGLLKLVTETTVIAPSERLPTVSAPAAPVVPTVAAPAAPKKRGRPKKAVVEEAGLPGDDKLFADKDPLSDTHPMRALEAAQDAQSLGEDDASHIPLDD